MLAAGWSKLECGVGTVTNAGFRREQLLRKWTNQCEPSQTYPCMRNSETSAGLPCSVPCIIPDSMAHARKERVQMVAQEMRLCPRYDALEGSIVTPTIYKENRVVKGCQERGRDSTCSIQSMSMSSGGVVRSMLKSQHMQESPAGSQHFGQQSSSAVFALASE